MVPVVFLIKSKQFPWFPLFLSLSRQARGLVIRTCMIFCRHGFPMFCPCFPAFFRRVSRPSGGSRVARDGGVSPLAQKKNAARQGGTIPPLPLRRPNAKNRPKAAFPAFLAGSGVFPFLRRFVAFCGRLGTFEAVNAQ